jgi:hypothetical protein
MSVRSDNEAEKSAYLSIGAKEMATGLHETSAAIRATTKSRASELRMQSHTLREFNKRIDGILADAGLRPAIAKPEGEVDSPEDPSLNGALAAAQACFADELMHLENTIDFLNSELLS